MDLFLKCPTCAIIQSKGKYCIYDGSLLYNLKTFHNDADSNFKEVRQVLDDLILKIEKKEEVHSKQNTFRRILKKQASRIDKTGDEIAIDFCVFIQSQELEANFDLKVCFMANNQRLDIEYKKNSENMTEYGIFKFVIKVKIPNSLINSNINYFYNLTNDLNVKIEQKGFRNFIVNGESITVIDGILLFENEYKDSELLSLKNKVIRNLLDTECLLGKEIGNECVRLTEQLKAVYGSLCSNDAQYLDLFKSILEEELFDILKYLEANIEDSEWKIFSVLVILCCFQKYSIVTFLNNISWFETICKLLSFKTKKYTSVLNVLVTNLLNEDRECLNEVLKRLLLANTTKFNSPEGIYLISISYFLNLGLNHHNSICNIDSLFGFDIGNKVINNLDGYINNFKELFENDMENDLSALFFNFFSTNDQNMRSILKSDKFDSLWLLNYLKIIFLSKQKELKNKSSQLYEKLDFLIKDLVKKSSSNKLISSGNIQNTFNLTKALLEKSDILDDINMKLQLIKLYLNFYQIYLFKLLNSNSNNSLLNFLRSFDFIFDFIKEWISNLFKKINLDEIKIYLFLYDVNLEINYDYLNDTSYKNYIINLFINRLNEVVNPENESYSNRLVNEKFKYILNLKVSLEENRDLNNNQTIRSEFDNFIFKTYFDDREKIVQNIKILCECLKDYPKMLEFYIDKILDTYVNQSNNCLDVLLENEILLIILEAHFYTYNRLLNKKWNDNIVKHLKSFVKCINDVINGKQSISIIKRIDSNQDEIFRLSKLIVERLDLNEFLINISNLNTLKNLIQLRNFEINEFVRYKNTLSTFLQFCTRFKDIDTRLYDDQIQLISNKFDNLTLTEICKPISFDLVQKRVDIKPVVEYFKEITQNEIIEMTRLCSLERLKCNIFDSYFIESCNRVKSTKNLNSLTILLVLKEVVPFVYEKWRAFASSIQNGTVKLTELDEYLEKFFSKNFDKMADELFYIIDIHKINNANQRKKQIQLYNEFKYSVEAAKLIEEIRVALKINQKFNELNNLLNLKSDEFKEWNLLKMDDSVERVIKTLNSVRKSDKIKCLKAFKNSIDLVIWLKTNIKDINQLKFFVDLASTDKTVETSHTINRSILAISLKEAGIAFAPLIFDMNVNDDFTKFMNSCEKVWVNLQRDKKIADKLLSLRDKISILDQIKSQKVVNVELSSINKAKLINEKGVYKICHLLPNNNEFIAYSEVNNSILNLIELEIKEEKGITKYSYDKLLELKSVLLVARKTQNVSKEEMKEVENETETLNYFIELFDDVCKLSELYLILLSKGCFFFKYFNALVYCDKNDKLFKSGMSTVEINLKRILINNHELKIESKQESTLKSLKQLIVFFEDRLEFWVDYVCSIRDRYTFINYYTTNQIMFLQKNIGQILALDQSTTFKDDFNHLQVYSLLSFLNPNINPRILGEVHQFSKSKFCETRKIAVMDKFRNKDENVERMIKQISVENNFNILIVRKAVKLYGIVEIDQIIDYCIINDPKDEKETEELMELEDVENQIETDLSDIESKKFLDKFHTVWDNYIKKQNEFNDEIFNLEQLAIFLDQLKLNNTQEIIRKIPGYLSHHDTPNLIICPIRDQIPIVLSIYAYTPDSPLPQYDEVLFCSSSTTSEEVENFFRIAFKSNRNKIYCLINIQDINYENSIKIDKFLSNAQINKINKFCIVCLSSLEKKEQSILVSSLLKYKVTPITLETVNIQNYLLKKFSNINENKIANYDPDKSCVRALLSRKPANGKSIYVKVFTNKIELENRFKFNYQKVRVGTNPLSVDDEVKKILVKKNNDIKNKLHGHPTIYHVDIAFEVFRNVELFIFNLVIMGVLKHSTGLVWVRDLNDFYFIEIMPPYINDKRSSISFHSLLNYLPKIDFRTPAKYYYDLSNLSDKELSKLHDRSFELYFEQIEFQRVCSYLKLLREEPIQVGIINITKRTNVLQPLNQIECLKVLLDYSELKNPNWAELHNFVYFLNAQLSVLENSESVCQIRELKAIFAKFLTMMAYDFGLPSLNIGDDRDVFKMTSDSEIEIEIHRLEIARRWESIVHPYIIFNSDRETFLFMGIYLDRRRYKFINPNTNEIIEESENEITSQLRIELLKMKQPIYDNFNEFPRTKKITSLRTVMGLDSSDQLNNDPDPSYELTLDNCLKLMAIYMRLACTLPVVVMGETGCGKTRLIKFFSDLYKMPRVNNLQHIMHFKIHGGITAQDIERQIDKAERLARFNKRSIENNGNNTMVKNGNIISLILFFDEANTTEAIGLIKEIMCDSTCNGRQIDLSNGLKLIAAVNPYKKHSQEMIKKLEEAGLGFYLSANDSKEKLGQIPMRELVYRVQPLPASMIPLVWDFGQLDCNTEKSYIKQMINKAIKNNILPRIDNTHELEVLYELIVQSQNFMRNQKNECSYVSIRDIERVITISSWFLKKGNLIFDRMKIKKLANFNDTYQDYLSHINKAFILGLSTCYHSCLNNNESRFNYRSVLGNIIKLGNYKHSRLNDWVLCEMLKCQHVFMDNLQLPKNIAKNSSLLENVYMMIICIELRIPLFIVGKPGSSKTLSKNIVAEAMIGSNSNNEIFRTFKETYFINFQCSPLTQPNMIIDAFTEAAMFQKNSNLEQSVAIVNLDEIGLAEGSESMPLKTLHSLIEDGTHSSDQVAQPYQKVGVIGISNWALDPAKLNRGIFVTRGEPDIHELIESAKGICNYEQQVYMSIEPYINQIAEAYLELCKESKKKIREFFGLRDFYSLTKMIYCFCSSDAKFTWNKLEHAVRRNFSGLNIDPVEPFRKLLKSKLTDQSDKDPSNNPMDIIQSALKSNHSDSISRYLLLITENNAIVDIIQSYLSSILKVPETKILVIFGSSFRNDLRYTEVCKNINRIKQAMELGNTVILLNSFNLYESLYDALNQYYQIFGGQRYVYLGLGTHRVNCLVHDDFRLIIIADRDSVYDTKRFPIPLINRLEKHILSSSIMLNNERNRIVNDILSWLKSTCTINMPNNNTSVTDVLIGYNEDTLATIVLNLCKERINLTERIDDTIGVDREEIITKTIRLLLRCASADSIVRLSANRSRSDLIGNLCLWTEYFEKQKHNSLRELIEQHINNSNENETDLNKNLIQITTHSKLNLSRNHINQLNAALRNNIESCKLESFETHQQFESKLKEFIENNKDNLEEKNILLIQCNLTECFYYDLLSCARFTIVERFKEYAQYKNIYIILLINLNRNKANKFIGFQVGHWSCYHLDEIDDSVEYLPSFQYLKGKSLSQLLEDSLNNPRSNQSLNLNLLMKNITYYSCSLIEDTNITRTIKRIEMFLKLCNDETFLKSICTRLIKLQKEKESHYMTQDMAKNWLNKEAASLKSINQNYTLKKSCKNYIESKLSPLLAFLLSKIDLHSNLDIYYNAVNKNEIKWRSDLWIEIFLNDDLLKLSYLDMRIKDSENNETEMSVFACNSKLNEENQNLIQNFPFFWILIQQLNDLVENFNYSYNLNQSNMINDDFSSESDPKLATFLKTIPKFFESTPSFKAVTPMFIKKSNEILNLYLNDFILYNCDVKSEREIRIIEKQLNKQIDESKVNRVNFKITMPLVHFKFDMISKSIFEYLKFSNFMPDINDNEGLTGTNITDIGLRACHTCIKIYEKKLESLDMDKSMRDLDTLLRLVQNVLTKNKSADIEKKYFSLTLLKLFYQNIISYNVSHIDFINKLINILKIKYLREIDSNKKNIIEIVHEFILTAIQKTREQLFKENTISKCCNVKCRRFRALYSDSCQCLICENCERIMINRLNNVSMKTTCLSCRKEIIVSRDFNNRISLSIDEKHDLSIFYNRFVQSLNAFYFTFVEFLILKETNNASKDFILKTISQGEITNDNLSLTIDHNCRSSVAEMLLKNSNDHTLKFLSSWFKQSTYLGDNLKATEMALIVDNCVQDIFNEKIARNNIDYEIDFTINTSKELISCCRNITHIFDGKNTNGGEYCLEYLIYLVKFKMCLRILAKFICGNVNIDSSKLKDRLDRFYTNIKELLAKTKSDTLHNYLIKQIIRKYGYANIKQIKNNKQLNWMTPEHIIGEDSNVTDKYVLIESKYSELKQAINDCITNNTTQFEAIMKKNINFAYLCMALYKNVTFIYKDQEIPTATKNNFITILSKYQSGNRHHWQQFIENSFTNNLKINKENWKTIDLNLLLVQIKYSILFSNSKLIKPLAELINSPRQFANSFVPGMPQDSVYDIQLAIRAAHPNENPTFYLCPNDHMYVLFDCGRPWVKTNCKTCGAEIGGTNHQLLVNNKTLKVEDKTLKGYCLPNASSSARDDSAKNEGVLNLSGLHTVRFIINCCLYFACDLNEQEVDDIMAVKSTERKKFFWNHINRDLSIISKSLNINLDEIMILMHLISDLILKNTIMYDFKWNTKDERKTWEQQFYEQFCSKYYKDTSSILNLALNKLKDNNNENETHKIYFMAYEFTDDKMQTKNLYENINFWKYKPEININIMNIQLNNQTNPDQFIKLKKFIEMRDKITLLSNLAPIVKFVNFLQNFYHKSLFKHYTQMVTIREILDKKPFPKYWSNEKVIESITAMKNAWNSLKQLVTDTTILNSNKLNPKFDYEFTVDSRLSYFLPTQYGDGFTCYDLIKNLCEIQNEILKFCFPTTEIDNKKVDLLQLEIDNNIIYYEESQLLYIIKSNYTYDTKESKLNFNFENITNSIIQKILSDKPLIDLNSFKYYEYADEINGFDLINKISAIIKQEPVNTIIQKKIFNEFKSSNEASEALSILKIIINYAKTASSNPDEHINKFIEKIYIESSWTNTKSILKFNIIESCQLKHLKYLWILIMIKKIFINMDSETPFENLNNEFKNVTENVDIILKNSSPSLVLSYCTILFQLIEFNFIYLSNEECSTISKYQLKYFVSDSMESLNVLNPENIDQIIESIPENLLMKHIFSIWIKSYEILKQEDI